MCLHESMQTCVESRCFALRALITQPRILKSFWVENSTNLNIYPFPRRVKLGKSLQTCCAIFYRLRWHFKREKPFFGKHLYCRTRTDYTLIKLRVQDFATGKNFSFNQWPKQRVFLFFLGKLFNKSNWKLLSCACIAWYKHSRGWENSWQLCEPETRYRVWFLVFISGYANTGKKFSIA